MNTFETIITGVIGIVYVIAMAVAAVVATYGGHRLAAILGA